MTVKSGNHRKFNHLLTVCIVLILMLLTICVSGEFLIRYLTRNDIDVMQVNGIAIPPLHPPLKQMRETIASYKARISHSPFIYDAQLGWNNQPFYEANGIVINSAAMRSSHEYDLTPADDTLRIAIFGDSFTYSAEVPDDKTLSHFMETSLQEKGIHAEVLNFGVPAYGVDQSYLRWLYEAVNYQPDIVIMSFSTRMSGRSLNIFRVINSPETLLPFSKPRFYLDDGTLQLVNSPTIPLDDVVETIQNFETHPLRDYEYYYDDRYIDTWWRQSMFVSYVVESIRNTIVSYVGDSSSESIEVNQAIIQAFADDVADNNGVFILGHMPAKKNLSGSEGNLQYLDILTGFADQLPLINAMNVLEAVDKVDGWLDDGHYNADGNQIVADYFASDIVDCLDNETCLPPRFTDNQSFRQPATDS